MSSSAVPGILDIQSSGFELYPPPTPFSQPPKPPRFVMLDHLENIFYDIDYQTPQPGNNASWTELGLHTVPDPAIVWPPNQAGKLQTAGFATGFLVSIESRSEGIFSAQKIGTVNVRPID